MISAEPYIMRFNKNIIEVLMKDTDSNSSIVKW